MASHMIATEQMDKAIMLLQESGKMITPLIEQYAQAKSTLMATWGGSRSEAFVSSTAGLEEKFTALATTINKLATYVSEVQAGYKKNYGQVSQIL